MALSIQILGLKALPFLQQRLSCVNMQFNFAAIFKPAMILGYRKIPIEGIILNAI
jgi:hypothetical protein